LPLDTPAVLKSIDRQQRIYLETIRASESGRTVTDDREHFLWMPVVTFDADSVRPRSDSDAFDYVVETMQKPTSVCALAQVQGHASADEPDARALSLVRARAVVARLVRRGVDPARLAAHGLGTRFAAGAPTRDRRVEIFCLRRHWVPPLPGSPAKAEPS
jgi:outer membrane protein OmpA-like peptidoglycan-associated protein